MEKEKPDYYVYGVNRVSPCREQWVKAGRAYYEEVEDVIRIELGYGVARLGGDEILLIREDLPVDVRELPVCTHADSPRLKLVVDN